MTYRITKSPITSQNVWWSPGEVIADGYEYVRDATPKEAAIIDRILAFDRQGLMPPSHFGNAIREALNPVTAP